MANSYKNIKELQDTLRNAGYEESELATSTRLILYITKSQLKDFKSIAQVIGGRYSAAKSGIGWRSSAGVILVGPYIIQPKPSRNELTSGSLETLNANLFTSYGKKETFEFGELKIKVTTFSNSADLEKSIIDGCLAIGFLGEPMADTIRDFFDTGILFWGDAPKPLVRKLGVYWGELLVGWTMFKNKESDHFTNNVMKGQIKKFYIPTDAAFSLFDSFIEMDDGSVYSISSKFGSGAKASIFGNLLKKGIENKTKLGSSKFKELCILTDALPSTNYKQSQKIVYAFGIRKILGLTAKQIPDPNAIYNEAKTISISNRAKASPELKLVMAAIVRVERGSPVSQALPKSISNYFNNAIAQTLNDDKASITQMRKIIAGTDFLQANLDSKKWEKGDVSFKFLASKTAKLKIVGSKGSIGDITSKQGWINYLLT